MKIYLYKSGIFTIFALVFTQRCQTPFYTEWRFISHFLHNGVRHLFTQNNEISYDLTTNVSYFAAAGVHNPEWVHIYPVEYFCPVLTTGEDVRLQSSKIAQRNYCEHKGLHSWSGPGGWKQKVLSLVSPKWKTKLIKLKRSLFN